MSRNAKQTNQAYEAILRNKANNRRNMNLGNTGNSNPQDILAELLTVDGADSGLDADLLDGKHASDILAEADLAASNKDAFILQDANNYTDNRFGGLSPVASTGDYNDLINTPDLSVFDEFISEASTADFPATGKQDAIYLSRSDGILYRWDTATSTYVDVSNAKVLVKSASAPANTNLLWFDTNVNKLRFHNGTAWTLSNPDVPLFSDTVDGLVPNSGGVNTEDKVLGSDGTWKYRNLKENGIITANTSLVLGDSVTFDCQHDHTITAYLPTATGSGKTIEIRLINSGYNSRLRLHGTNVGATINRIGGNGYTVGDQLIRLVDSAPGRYTTTAQLNYTSVNINVPGDANTIQEALDLAANIRVASGSIVITLADGTYDITSNFIYRGHDKVYIRGTTAQYFPRYERPLGLANTPFTGVYADDKATVEGFGGAILKVNISTNGLNMSNAGKVSFRYITIMDNWQNDDENNPANYLVRYSECTDQENLYFDRVCFFGGKTGLYLNGISSNIYVSHSIMVHAYNSAVSVSRCPNYRSYRQSSLFCLYGIYIAHSAIASCSRWSCYNATGGRNNNVSRRGVYAVGNAYCYLTYPQVETLKECIYAIHSSVVYLYTTADLADINQTYFKTLGTQILVMLTGNVIFGVGSTANCRFIGSAVDTIIVYLQHGAIGYTSSFLNHVGEVICPNTYRMYASKSSTGQTYAGANGGANPAAVLVPPLNTTSADNARWSS